jgi:hypothetical protein
MRSSWCAIALTSRCTLTGSSGRACRARRPSAQPPRASARPRNRRGWPARERLDDPLAPVALCSGLDVRRRRRHAGRSHASASRVSPLGQEVGPVLGRSRWRPSMPQRQCSTITERVLLCRNLSIRRRRHGDRCERGHEALTAAVRGWAERAGVRDAARAALEGPRSDPCGGRGSPTRDCSACTSRRGRGSGAGGVELAIAVEELGRTSRPGPSCRRCSRACWSGGPSGTAAKELLPSLSTGPVTAAVAMSCGDLRATRTEDG